MRIDVSGALRDGAGGIPVSGLPVSNAMAFGGGRSLVVGDVSTLVAATLDTSAIPTAGPTVTVALAANVQSMPAAAYDGSGYVVTWFDLRVTSGVVMGARLDENGVTRDPQPMTVYTGAAINYPVHDAVMASNGTDFIVAWRGGSGPTTSSGFNVMARSVSASGDVPGSATAIAVSDAYAPTDIAIGFGGTAYSVFWSEMGPVPVRAAIRGARLGTDAAFLGQVTIAATLPSTRPAVACAPNRCLLAYTEAPTNGPSPMYTAPGAIRGVFLNDALAKGAVFTIASGTNDPQQTPQVAFDGTNWLVTWRDAAGHTLQGARVDTNGTVLDASPLAIAQNQTLGKVTSSFDGTDYLLAWESGGLRLARITTAGTVLDPGGVAGPAGGAGPALAGRLLAYSRPVSGRSRVVVRLRAPARVVEDGGVDGAPADGDVLPADGSVDSAPADASVDGGPDGGIVSDAGADGQQPGADASTDATLADAGGDEEPGGHHHRWPPLGHGCSIVDADTTTGPWAGLLFALIVVGIRRNRRASRREERVSERSAS